MQSSHVGYRGGGMEDAGEDSVRTQNYSDTILHRMELYFNRRQVRRLL